jgi:ActR/RegA family two-component response regulator
MLIECQSCQKKLNISEEKIPFGRPFTFVCPNCAYKNAMTLPERRITEISLNDDAPPPPPPSPPTFRSGAGSRQSTGSTFTSQGLGATPPDFALPPEIDEAPEGIKLAMIVFDNEEVQQKLSETLTAMGFRVTVAVNVRDAVKQLKFGRFQLIVIQEDYYGASLATNQIVRAVNSVELAVRHDMFVAVVGDGFTSLDDLTAFSLSLDTVINNKDLEDIERILISAMGHSRKFFQTYRDMMLQRGIDYR